MGALEILTDPRGGRPAKRPHDLHRRLVPQILAPGRRGAALRLAISLHAASDELRSKLCGNRASPRAAHAGGADPHREGPAGRVTFEYNLDRGEQPTPIGDAAKLVRLVGQLPCRINSDPYNPIGPGRFRRPSPTDSSGSSDYLGAGPPPPVSLAGRGSGKEKPGFCRFFFTKGAQGRRD